MTNPDFAYTTYIKSTPEKVWSAVTNPEFTKQYWGAHENISDWKKGSKWTHVGPGGVQKIWGEVLESNPPRRLAFTWVNPDDATDVSRVIFDIEPLGDMVRLNVTHGDFKSGSDMGSKVSRGWPLVLSSMKSFLETGKPVDISAVKSCSEAA